jgi:uncharacterized protein YndB with AHSA1/START domain
MSKSNRGIRPGGPSNASSRPSGENSPRFAAERVPVTSRKPDPSGRITHTPGTPPRSLQNEISALRAGAADPCPAPAARTTAETKTALTRIVRQNRGIVRYALTLEIARPVEEVFDFLADVSNLPRWQKSSISARAEGPMDVGTRVREVRRFLGRRLENKLEVTEFERPRLLTLRATSGPVPFTVRHELSATDKGTRVDFVGEGEPGKFFRLAEPLVARRARSEFTRDFARLKSLLETR